MRTALSAVATQLYSMTDFDDGLLRVDSLLGPTAGSTLIDPKHLAMARDRVVGRGVHRVQTDGSSRDAVLFELCGGLLSVPKLEIHDGDR